MSSLRKNFELNSLFAKFKYFYILKNFRHIIHNNHSKGYNCDGPRIL